MTMLAVPQLPQARSCWPVQFTAIDDVAALDSLTKGDKGENNVERFD